MEYLTMELCEILLDLIALSVCVFMVLFIVISTFKKKDRISGIEQKEQIGNFDESVMAQIVKQQLYKSLIDVVDAVNDKKLSNNQAVRNQAVPEKFVQEKIAKEPEPVDPDEYNQNEYDQVESNNSEMMDKSLTDIVDAVNDKKLSNNQAVPEKFVQEKIAKEPEPVGPDEYNQNESDQIESGKPEMIDKYDEAAGLAKSGMNACDIADRVKLSMCEIELIVKLNRLRNESSRAA
jgi:hypothetical protein